MIYLISNNTNLFEYFKTITLEESLSKLESLKEISNDTETSGFSCHTKKLLSIQLGNDDFQIVYDIASYGGIIPRKLKDFMNQYEGILQVSGQGHRPHQLLHVSSLQRPCLHSVYATTHTDNR